jgi:hypothetical protein
MLEPTWAATNSPQAAPANARPMRSRIWADVRTRDRMALPDRWDASLVLFPAARNLLAAKGRPAPTQFIVRSERRSALFPNVRDHFIVGEDDVVFDKLRTIGRFEFLDRRGVAVGLMRRFIFKIKKCTKQVGSSFWCQAR